MKPSTINTIFQRLQQSNPHPTTELKYNSVFELLVAVILSAHSTDVSVNKATEKLFAVANTPEKIYQLGEMGLKEYIKSIGLYNAKAANIIKTCRILIDQYHSEVPRDFAALKKLHGVGAKTAGVILNTAFGEPIIAVDTHVFRVANRLGLAHGKTTQEVAKQLMQVVPDEFKSHAAHWLVLHGRYICKAKKPLCEQCLLADCCEYYRRIINYEL
jgi:endonuclease-3